MYTYDMDGIRTKKVVNGVTTEYFLSGTTILAEKTGNNVTWYIYDADGEILGLIYNGETYYYLKNQQGDVISIVDENMNVVNSYTYDAWGKVTDITGNGTIGAINPIRYRGYYYDNETGLYYLNSRYYDPEIGRFINADDTAFLGASGTVLGYNLFAYCENNPVNSVDTTGEIAVRVLVSAAIGGVVAALLEIVLQVIQGKTLKNLDWKSIGIEFLNGALTGGLIGLGLNPGWTNFGRALINMVTSIGHSIRKKEGFWKTIGSALFSGLATYAYGQARWARGKSIISKDMVTSIVQTLKTRFSRFVIRLGLWKITVTI